MCNTACSIILLLSCLYMSAANDNLENKMKTLGREVANEIAEKAFSQLQHLTFHVPPSNIKFLIEKPLVKGNFVEMYIQKITRKNFRWITYSLANNSKDFWPSFKIIIKYPVNAEVNGTMNKGYLLLKLTCNRNDYVLDWPQKMLCDHACKAEFPEQIGNIKDDAELLACGYNMHIYITGKKKVNDTRSIISNLIIDEWKETHDKMAQMLNGKYGKESFVHLLENATAETEAEKHPDTSYSF